MDIETQLIEANRSVTLPDGSNIIYPSTNALGDFQGTPQDANTNPSYIPSSWLNLINRFMGRLLLAKGVTPSSTITAAQLSSAVSPYWEVGGDYLAGDIKIKNSTRYTCTSPHRSSPANAPGVVGAPWENYDIYQLKLAYPVGSIYANASRTENPSVYLGFGIWAAIPAGHAVAALGDELKLGETVTDQFQGHRHETHWHASDGLDGGNNTRPRNPDPNVNGGDIHELSPYGAPRVGSVTRGKRFGANIWQRIS